MAITRAQAESLVVGRCKDWLAKASLLTTVDGSNSDLNDPIRNALTVMGVPPADPMAVVDSDLVRLDPLGGLALDEFLDRAELRTLKTVRGRFTKTSTMVDGIMVYTSDLLRQLTAVIAAKEAEMKASWGLASGGLSVGLLTGGFAETLDECG